MNLSNKELLEKYPFLIVRNRKTRQPEEILKNETELFGMPAGWRESFGEQLCEEIKNELDKMDSILSSDYKVFEIKNSYNRLHWHSNWTTMEIDKIIEKYADLSEKTCCMCGMSAEKRMVGGRIWPCCNSCYEEFKEEFGGN